MKFLQSLSSFCQSLSSLSVFCADTSPPDPFLLVPSGLHPLSSLCLGSSSTLLTSTTTCTAGCTQACVLSLFSHVWLLATPCTVAHQAPLLMGFSRQEYWSGLPCPLPGDLPYPGIEPVSLLHCRAGSLPLVPPDKPLYCSSDSQIFMSSSKPSHRHGSQILPTGIFNSAHPANHPFLPEERGAQGSDSRRGLKSQS